MSPESTTTETRKRGNKANKKTAPNQKSDDKSESSSDEIESDSEQHTKKKAKQQSAIELLLFKAADEIAKHLATCTSNSSDDLYATVRDTVQKLSEAYIFTPQQFFALTDSQVEKLQIPLGILTEARVINNHSENESGSPPEDEIELLGEYRYQPYETMMDSYTVGEVLKMLLDTGGGEKNCRIVKPSKKNNKYVQFTPKHRTKFRAPFAKFQQYELLINKKGEKLQLFGDMYGNRGKIYEDRIASCAFLQCSFKRFRKISYDIKNKEHVAAAKKELNNLIKQTAQKNTDSVAV